MSHWRHRLGGVGLRLAAAAAVALWALEAGARVGGGESFGTGGGYSGGGYSGGSSSYSGGSYSGGGDGDGLLLLLWLLLEYPQIGVPVALFAGGYYLYTQVQQSRERDRIARGPTPWSDGPPLYGDAPIELAASGRRRLSSIPGLDRLRETDPGFSMPVLLDYLTLLHRRALEAAVDSEWDGLQPFVDIHAQNQLERDLAGVQAIDQIVVGTLSVTRASRQATHTVLEVRLMGTRRERRGPASSRVLVEERWSLRRANDARSLAPEATARLGCPSCGSAVDTDRQGRCTACGTGIVTGLLQWQLHDVLIGEREPIRPPRVGLLQGGDEPSVRAPVVRDPDLRRELEAFRSRHPDFRIDAFRGRVEGVYFALQTAWDAGQWDQARPHVTETLYQSLRYWLEQYAEGGLRNRLDGISLEQQEIVKVELDAWYEALTVRIVGSMKDWVEDGQGKVIGGNQRVSRRFAEYWTFLRAAGTGADSRPTSGCPSCGAPLDRVSQTGECGYCDSVITTGRFDWVLSRIDQAQVYRG